MEADCDGRDMNEAVLGDIGKESRILVDEPLDSASRALGRLMEEPARVSSSLSSDEPAPPATITSSSSMELDLSERERVAELARLDKVLVCIFFKMKRKFKVQIKQSQFQNGQNATNRHIF